MATDRRAQNQKYYEAHRDEIIAQKRLSTRRVVLSLHRKNDAALIAALEALPNMQGYITALLREHLLSEGS